MNDAIKRSIEDFVRNRLLLNNFHDYVAYTHENFNHQYYSIIRIGNIASKVETVKNKTDWSRQGF